MTSTDFYKLIDQIIEADPGTITGNEVLADLAAWDSLAIVGFIAAVDSNLGITVPAKGLVAAKTVEDLRQLVAAKLSD